QAACRFRVVGEHQPCPEIWRIVIPQGAGQTGFETAVVGRVEELFREDELEAVPDDLVARTHMTQPPQRWDLEARAVGGAHARQSLLVAPDAGNQDVPLVLAYR